MKHLIVTADDYGVFPAINNAVIEAIQGKKINSVSVLANYKGTEKYPGSEANLKKLLDETGDGADIGCHLTVTSGKPLTGEKMNFACDNNGNFFSFTEFKNFKSPEEKKALKEELCEQVNELHRITGFKIKHLTNHHNSLTLFQHHLDVYMEVARLFGVPMRSTLIRPTTRQNIYLRFLNFKLQDDIDKEERQEILRFKDEIVEYFNRNAAGIKAPKSLDSRHYGPLSEAPVVNLAGQFIVQKRLKLNKLFRSFLESEEENMELLVHLAKADGLLVDKSRDLDYPGVDQDYFDSRALEFLSIMGYKFDKWEGMEQKGWSSLL